MDEAKSDGSDRPSEIASTCETLTSAALGKLAAPWNSAVGALNARYKANASSLEETLRTRRQQAHSKRDAIVTSAAGEIQGISRNLASAREHFKGLEVSLFEPAYEEAVAERSRSGNPPKYWSDPSEAGRVEQELQQLKKQPRIEGTTAARTFSWIKEYGGYSFAAMLVGGWILWTFGTAFWLAIVGTLALALIKTINAEAGAKPYVTSLVKAAADRAHWLEHSSKPSAMSSAEREVATAESEYQTARQELESAYERELASLTRVADSVLAQIDRTVRQVHALGQLETAPWSDSEGWSRWEPASALTGVVRIGDLGVVLAQPVPGFERVIEGTRLRTPVKIPLVWTLAGGQSLYFHAADTRSRTAAYAAAQNVALRVLAFTPPGKLMFTLIDPIGQGQNVASLLALADHDEQLINSKVWTDAKQIERKLTDLTEHMETVIQKYLRSDYASIDDYNRDAGEIAEAYRVVIAFDFPDSFTEGAARQLERIVQNGARCGVFAVIVRDAAKRGSYGVEDSGIRKHTLVYEVKDGVFTEGPVASKPHKEYATLRVDGSPPDSIARLVVAAVGDKAKDALKVEVPFEKLLQQAGLTARQVWSESAVEGIRIPLGPGSARKTRYLELGVGLSVHALIIGRPGSGKSNLMHVVITTAARMYAPSELQLYLIDFKEGVEFKPYAETSLPSVPVVAIRSEREFGISVLRKLDGMLKERADVFRSAGVSSFAEFRRQKGAAETLPRVLLVVDEFQEFFVRQDRLADEAALLLDRIVRQGRAFGIHLLLGSQTLAGYSLPRATLNLITVRIALQSSEADSRIILAEDNTAARLLSRPGEAIYNASSGLIEGNAPFQVAIFGDDDRRRVLSEVAAHMSALPVAQRQAYPATVVFEGHEPASIERSSAFDKITRANGAAISVIRLPVGEPIEIKPPTTVSLPTRAGGHLLVVDRNEAQGVAVLAAAVAGIAAQLSRATARVNIVNMTTSDAEWTDIPHHLANAFGSRVQVLDRRGLEACVDALGGLVKQYLSSGKRPAERHFLAIFGLHRVREFRQESPRSRFAASPEGERPDVSATFVRILREGAEAGIHVLAWCDTLSSLDKLGEPRLITEFGTRLVGPMSSSDSHKLLDDDAASKIERPHRMIKFDEDRVGVLETFRPFAMPSLDWLTKIGRSTETN